jgi:hypothetical protein
MPFGLLGQAGFFSKFEVYFNYKEKEILLRDRSKFITNEKNGSVWGFMRLGFGDGSRIH